MSLFLAILELIDCCRSDEPRVTSSDHGGSAGASSYRSPPYRDLDKWVLQVAFDMT
jgi:hypothetical protein